MQCNICVYPPSPKTLPLFQNNEDLKSALGYHIKWHTFTIEFSNGEGGLFKLMLLPQLQEAKIMTSNMSAQSALQQQ